MSMRSVLSSDPVAFGTYLGSVAKYAAEFLTVNEPGTTDMPEAVDIAFATVSAPESIRNAVYRCSVSDWEREAVYIMVRAIAVPTCEHNTPDGIPCSPCEDRGR
jgi:hypothetical protein